MLLYASAPAHNRPAVRARVDALAALLLPLVRLERVMLNMALNPALVFKFAAPHVLLTKLGYGDEAFDRFLESCLASEAGDGQERPPSARVERQWLSSLHTGEDTAAGWQTELARSVLEAPLDILGGRRDDAYAWTHLLMYSTDFGNQPWRVPERPIARCRRRRCWRAISTWKTTTSPVKCCSPGRSPGRRGPRRPRSGSRCSPASKTKCAAALRQHGHRAGRGAGRGGAVRVPLATAYHTVTSWGSCAPRRCGPDARRRCRCHGLDPNAARWMRSCRISTRRRGTGRRSLLSSRRTNNWP